jgi:hypothetical protein
VKHSTVEKRTNLCKIAGSDVEPLFASEDRVEWREGSEEGHEERERERERERGERKREEEREEEEVGWRVKVKKKRA